MATAEIARNLCPLTAPDGTQFVFFNTEVISKGRIDFIEDIKTSVAKYSIVFTDDEVKKKYRALHYSRYYLNSAIEAIPRLVPFSGITPKEQTEMAMNQGTAYASALYEAISPAAASVPGFPGACLLFWTNLTEPFHISGNNTSEYERSKIVKFENDKLEDYDLDLYTHKALCAAMIDWQQLKTVGGFVQDSSRITTPVVTAVHVLMTEKSRAVVDFSNGSGGGLNIHNHSDNSNGGFAYAVFAPGTSVQPVNWR